MGRVGPMMMAFDVSREGKVTVHDIVPQKKTTCRSDFCFVKGADFSPDHEPNNEMIHDEAYRGNAHVNGQLRKNGRGALKCDALVDCKIEDESHGQPCTVGHKLIDFQQITQQPSDGVVREYAHSARDNKTKEGAPLSHVANIKFRPSSRLCLAIKLSSRADFDVLARVADISSFLPGKCLTSGLCPI